MSGRLWRSVRRGDEIVHRIGAPQTQIIVARDRSYLEQNLPAPFAFLSLSPIETDAQGCIVQMRSNPPQKESDRTSYYELLVSRTGELSLARYSRAAGQEREVIPAQVTREVLARLVDDFSSVAS